MTAFLSSGANDISAIWCPHSGAKPRSPFPLTVSTAQRSLHTVLLLGDAYKKSQSLILSLLQIKVRDSGKWLRVNGQESTVMRFRLPITHYPT